jgi:hypothetical protein
MRQSSVNALCAASSGSPVCAQDRTMLQRVVRNRFEFSVSLPAGSVFKGEHDGIFVASEQAQTLQAPAERVAFHSGEISLLFCHYEICWWKFLKNLSKSEFVG